jgi:hypothetical protein
VRFTTDPDDQPLKIPSDPEMIEVYLIQRPRKSLLDLPMLEDYDPDDVTCARYILPIERAANVQTWENFIHEIKHIDS